MALTSLTIRVDEAEAAYLDQVASQHEGILSKQGVMRLLLQQAQSFGWDPLDRPITLGEPSTKGEGSTSKAVSSIEEELITTKQPLLKTRAKKPKDGFSSRVIPVDLVPDDLLDCQQLLLEFWAVKKGTRSEGVWNRVCNRLRGWTREQRHEALSRAIANGWGDVFEPKPQTPAQRHGGQPRKSLLDQAREVGMI